MEKEKLVQTVKLAQKGDSDALNELFNAFYNDVYYFALKNVKDEDLACDITQEAFVEIINTLGNLKEPAAFVTWMKQITYHQCTRYFKKKKDVLVDENEDGDTIFDTIAEERTEFIPDEAVDQADFRTTIMGMIDQLPDEQRAATMMYYFDEMSVKEIAQAQGVGENTVKGRLSYSRKAIKKSVEDYEKKNNVKLHCVGLLPLLLWLFRNYGKAMPVASAKAVAEGVSTATGVGICVAAGSGAVTATVTTTAAVGLGAKIAAIPLAIKVTAAVVAAAIAVSAVAIGMNRDGENNPVPTTLQNQNTHQDVLATLDPTENDDTSLPPQDNNTSTPSEDDHTATPPKDDNTATPPKDDNTDIPPENEESQPFLVPAGCTYTAVTGEVYEGGDPVTVPLSTGDHFTDGEYDYYYNRIYYPWEVWDTYNGWSVVVRDNTKTSYAPVISPVNGEEITEMRFTYYNCEALETAPILPEKVENLSSAFMNCSALKEPPAIPGTVRDMECAFANCRSMTTPPNVPAGVTNMDAAFYYCASLKTAPVLPSGITNMDCMFEGCEALTVAPRIPDGVTTMVQAFWGCTSLRKAPDIPSSVTCICRAFYHCPNLQGLIVIDGELHSNSNEMPYCIEIFSYDMTRPIFLAGDNSQLFEISRNYQNYNIFTTHISYHGQPNNVEYYVPAGCVYTAVTGEVFHEGERVTVRCSMGDEFTDGEYVYWYAIGTVGKGTENLGWWSADNGWYPDVIDRTKKEYLPVLTSINGDQISGLLYTYKNCSNLVTAPEIPEGIERIDEAFRGCTSLVAAPVLPSTVKYMNRAFYGCSSLEQAPVIPASVIEAYGAFGFCEKLHGEIIIHAELQQKSSDDEGYLCLFDGCQLPIALSGTSSQLEKIAELYENVYVK